MSAGVVIFAKSIIFLPSAVTDGLPINEDRRRSFSFCRRSFSSAAFTVALSGSIYTAPEFPSAQAVLPSQSGFMSSIPTMAGMPMVLARMDVWEVAEPYFVIKAKTESLSKEAVSPGDRSSAATMNFSPAGRDVLLPARVSIRPSVMSSTSAALSLIYSESDSLSDSARRSPVSFTAYSAFTDWLWIIFSISPIKSGSISIRLWVSNIMELSSPAWA